MTKWIVAERAKIAMRHAVACPNVTGRTNERVAQSKRARARMLAIVISLSGVVSVVLHFSDVEFFR